MSVPPETDLPQFVSFATEQLENGGSQLTPEEVLNLWRAQHPAPEDFADAVEALERALAQADRGEGRALEEFDKAFRTRHQIAADE